MPEPKPLITTTMLEEIAADPARLARVLAAAAQALNTLSFYAANPDAQRLDFATPNAEAMTAHEILLHGFTDWDRVVALLGCTRPAVSQ